MATSLALRRKHTIVTRKSHRSDMTVPTEPAGSILVKFLEPVLNFRFFVLGAIEKCCEVLYFLQKLVQLASVRGLLCQQRRAFSKYDQDPTLAFLSSYTSLGELLSTSRTLRKIAVGERGF